MIKVISVVVLLLAVLSGCKRTTGKIIVDDGRVLQCTRHLSTYEDVAYCDDQRISFGLHDMEIIYD